MLCTLLDRVVMRTDPDLDMDFASVPAPEIQFGNGMVSLKKSVWVNTRATISNLLCFFVCIC